MDEPDAQEATVDVPSARSSSVDSTVSPRWQANDAAFVAFYRDCLPRLAAFLRWQGVPLHEAADLSQKTMIQAYQCWSTIDKPHAWVRRVASRLWARKVAQAVEAPAADIPERPSSLAITEVEAWEQRHEVLRILDRLPARQRQVLAWNLDGYTPAEIAAELRMTPEAVRGSLAKARRAVATYLRETGSGDDQQSP